VYVIRWSISLFRKATVACLTALALAIAPCAAQTFSPPSHVLRDAPVAPAPPQSVPAPRPNNVQHWGALFMTQVRRCWKKQWNAGQEPHVQAVFAIKLKRDGMVEEARILSINSTTPYAQAYQASSLRALNDCQPYKLPEVYYDEWRSFQPVFTEQKR
jgi:hypothetical protein